MQPLQIKHHSPALAAGLNWLTPGLGLYYLGHATAARWALFLTLLPGFAWLLLPRFFSTVRTDFAGGRAVVSVCVADDYTD